MLRMMMLLRLIEHFQKPCGRKKVAAVFNRHAKNIKRAWRLKTAATIHRKAALQIFRKFSKSRLPS